MKKLTGETKEFKLFLEENEYLGVVVNEKPFIHKEELKKMFEDYGIARVYEIHRDSYLGIGIKGNLRIEAM